MPAPLVTYSFGDVKMTIIGPGIAASVGGDGAGSAKEGITIEPTEDKDVMTLSADGAAMHSLVLANPAKITIRLLKTSPINALLNAAYNLQKSVSGLWGQNAFVLTNVQTGDMTSCLQTAFSRHSGLTYGTEGGINAWEFLCGNYQPILGNGTPNGNNG